MPSRNDIRLPGYIFAGSFEAGFKLDLMKKDVNIGLDSARSQGVPLLLASTVAQILSAASAAGNGNADYSIAAQFLADISRVQLSRPAGAQQGSGK